MAELYEQVIFDRFKVDADDFNDDVYPVRVGQYMSEEGYAPVYIYDEFQGGNLDFRRVDVLVSGGILAGDYLITPKQNGRYDVALLRDGQGKPIGLLIRGEEPLTLMLLKEVS